MLWDAGQERLARESRDRLVERYVAARDGYVSGNVALGKATSRGDGHVPGYARGAARQPDPAAQRATLARIARMFPGAVRRGDS